MTVKDRKQDKNRETARGPQMEDTEEPQNRRSKKYSKQKNNLAYRIADTQEFTILRPDGTLDHYTPRGMVEAGYYDSTETVRNWLLWSVLTGYLTPIGPCMFRQRTITEMRLYAPGMFTD